MSIVIYISLAVAIAALFYFLRVRRRFRAALNIYMARYTFDRLTREQKANVKEEAKQLVLGSGMDIEGYENDVERFGWYALAMNALNIPSKLPDNPKWHKIRNPSKAIKRGDSFLRTVSNMIKQNYSIEMTIQ